MDELRGWTPAKVTWQRELPVVEWRQLGHLRFADPFFDDTLQRALVSSNERRTTPIGALGQLASDSPGVPLGGLIFHLSRCGSTLLSQLLAAVPSHVVISEAPPIDALVGAAAPEELRIKWLRWMVSALGQRRLGDERRLFIKLDAWNAIDLPLLMRAFPSVPWIFVYRDPLEVLVSHVRRRGSHMVPGLLPPSRLALSEADTQLPFDKYGARVLGAIAEAGLRGFAAGGGRLVNHSELPGAAEELVRSHFHVELDESDRQRMATLSERHGKRPDEIYQDDRAEKRAAATAELRRFADEEAADVYRRLELARAGHAPETRASPSLIAPPPRAKTPTSVRLALSFDAAALRADLEPLASEHVAHFNTGYYDGDWSGVTLRGPGGDSRRLHPDLAGTLAVADTALMPRCPSVKRALSTLHCEVGTVRLLRLAAGASIREHSDLDLAFESGEARLHIVVTTNSDVEFVVDWVRSDMREGECWYHDFSRIHRVENRGASDRLHLVVDCRLNDWLRRLILDGAG